MLAAQLPTYANFIAEFFNELNSLLEKYVYDGYHAFVSFVSKPLEIIAILYLVIFGLCIMKGWVAIHFGTFTKAVIKIGAIYMLATNWDWVSFYIVNLFNAIINDMGSVLLKVSPLQSSPLGVQSINEALQLVLTQLLSIAQLFYKSGGVSNALALLQGAIIQGAAYGLVGAALFEVTLAKVLMSVLLVLLPACACFYFFEATKGFFERYAGALMGSVLVQVLINAILALGLQLTYWSFHGLQQSTTSALDIGIFGIVPVVIVSLITILMIFKMAAIARYIASSIVVPSGATLFQSVSAITEMLEQRTTISENLTHNNGAHSQTRLDEDAERAKSSIKSFQSRLRQGE